MRAATIAEPSTGSRDTFRAALGALPSSIAYGHIGLIGILDCAMVGSLGVTPVAAVGFAANVLGPFYILSTGITFALPPIVAREHLGSGASSAAARLEECLRAQALVAGASMVVLLLLSRRLGVFHQPVEVEQAAQPYLLGMIALVPVFAFAALREYAISLGRPRMPGAFAAVAIAIKVLFGMALVHGSSGTPRLGALAAGTSIGYGAAAALFALTLSRCGLLPWPRSARLGARERPSWCGEFFAQGLPVSLQQLFEIGAFYVAGIMAGWLGASALAGHHIGLNLANGAALFSLSTSQNTSAQVSRRAAAQPSTIGRAAFGGVGISLAVMAVVGIISIVARGTLFRAAPGFSSLALLVAPALLADGVQMALAGALRGLVDTRFLSVVTLVGWWLFCLPLAYALAFVAGYGVHGIWAALTATLGIFVVILAVRFATLTRVGRFGDPK